jgi:predicted transcriptional regulator of viral defense system
MIEPSKIPLSKAITKKIKALPEGTVFNYSYFDVPASGELALAKALSRLTASGTITRIAKGKYYKPKETSFGKLKPQEDEIIKSLTYKGDKTIGYLTGIALYNRLALTTQVPNTLTIATNNILPSKKIGPYKIKYSKRNVAIEEKDIPLLQLLDVLMDIRTIPDTDVNKTFEVVLDKIKKLDAKQKSRLLKLSFQYNPATRALAGALFERYIDNTNLNSLKETLNPLSKYDIGISEKILSNKSNWNIQ